MDRQTALAMMNNMEDAASFHRDIIARQKETIRRLRQALRDAGVPSHIIQKIEQGKE